MLFVKCSCNSLHPYWFVFCFPNMNCSFYLLMGFFTPVVNDSPLPTTQMLIFPRYCPWFIYSLNTFGTWSHLLLCLQPHLNLYFQFLGHISNYLLSTTYFCLALKFNIDYIYKIYYIYFHPCLFQDKTKHKFVSCLIDFLHPDLKARNLLISLRNFSLIDRNFESGLTSCITTVGTLILSCLVLLKIHFRFPNASIIIFQKLKPFLSFPCLKVSAGPLFLTE